MPKFVIADQNLDGFVGHYWEYDAAVATLLRDRKHETVILGKKNLSSALSLTGVSVLPWFSYSSGDTYRPALYRDLVDRFGMIPKPLLKVLKIGYRSYKKLRGAVGMEVAAVLEAPVFAQECLQALSQLKLTPDDKFFIQTIYMAELRSLAKGLLTIDRKSAPQILIMLRREPEETNMSGLEEVLEMLSDWIGDKVFFVADTPALAHAYEQIYGMNVTCVPVMCDIPLIRRLQQQVAGQTATTHPRRITYMGNARKEKGFHLLPGLIDALKNSYPRFNELEFHLQSYTLADEVDLEIDAAIAKLKQYGGNVHLYDQPLTQEEYVSLLAKSDLLLLPYDAQAYQRRSSGILMQAIAGGKVAVIPDHIWMSRSVPDDAAQRFNPGTLHHAVLQALNNFGSLNAAAQECGKQLQVDKLLEEFYRGINSQGSDVGVAGVVKHAVAAN